MMYYEVTNLSNNIKTNLQKQLEETNNVIDYLLKENFDSNKCKYYTPVILNKISTTIDYNKLLKDDNSIQNNKRLFKQLLDFYVQEYVDSGKYHNESIVIYKLREEYIEENLHGVVSLIDELYRSSISSLEVLK